MSKKEWIAVYNGHNIRVTDTLLRGGKLYIDDDCLDTTDDMFALASSPALSARVTPTDGEPFLVEVFMEGLTSVKAKICVNGTQVGGDVL
jgi:hypothetical protein